jgi:hypothetical protein
MTRLILVRHASRGGDYRALVDLGDALGSFLRRLDRAAAGAEGPA